MLHAVVEYQRAVREVLDLSATVLLSRLGRTGEVRVYCIVAVRGRAAALLHAGRSSWRRGDAAVRLTGRMDTLLDRSRQPGAAACVRVDRRASAGASRRLFPTIMMHALSNPLSWLLFATGGVRRSLATALVIAPVALLAYALGLSGGPNGVALSYSRAMVCLAIPLVFWARRGTSITVRDI